MLILSGDHIYKMDYAKMLAYHKAQKATATISVLEVTMEEATRFGIMNVDENDTIYEFEEKPAAAQEQSGLHGHLHLHLVQAARSI